MTLSSNVGEKPSVRLLKAKPKQKQAKQNKQDKVAAEDRVTQAQHQKNVIELATHRHLHHRSCSHHFRTSLPHQ